MLEKGKYFIIKKERQKERQRERDFVLKCTGIWDSVLKLQKLIDDSQFKSFKLLLDLTCLIACLIYACVFIARHCDENKN